MAEPSLQDRLRTASTVVDWPAGRDLLLEAATRIDQLTDALRVVMPERGAPRQP